MKLLITLFLILTLLFALSSCDVVLAPRQNVSRVYITEYKSSANYTIFIEHNRIDSNEDIKIVNNRHSADYTAYIVNSRIFADKRVYIVY